eukprot:4111738-Prymnesium_polylepis.1
MDTSAPLLNIPFSGTSMAGPNFIELQTVLATDSSLADVAEEGVARTLAATPDYEPPGYTVYTTNAVYRGL